MLTQIQRPKAEVFFCGQIYEKCGEIGRAALCALSFFDLTRNLLSCSLVSEVDISPCTLFRTLVPVRLYRSFNSQFIAL